MTLALLCSGQGGQHAAMFALTGDAPEAAPVFAAAAALLGGHDPRDLVRDPAADLHGNRTAQILCVTQALAACAALRLAPDQPVLLAGYSVGELAAWGCAGLLPPEHVLQAAARRAESMDAVAAASTTGLVGLRGLLEPVATALATRHGARVAIVNAADSVVVGGPRASLEALCREALAMGASRAVILPVAVASHTAVLAPATTSFAAVLQDLPLRRLPAGRSLLCSLDGSLLRDPDAGRSALAAQLSAPVRWDLCLEAARERGTTRLLELGPGQALATMASAALPDADVRALEAFRTLDGLRAFAARRNGR